MFIAEQKKSSHKISRNKKLYMHACILITMMPVVVIGIYGILPLFSKKIILKTVHIKKRHTGGSIETKFSLQESSIEKLASQKKNVAMMDEYEDVINGVKSPIYSEAQLNKIFNVCFGAVHGTQKQSAQTKNVQKLIKKIVPEKQKSEKSATKKKLITEVKVALVAAIPVAQKAVKEKLLPEKQTEKQEKSAALAAAKKIELPPPVVQKEKKIDLNVLVSLPVSISPVISKKETISSTHRPKMNNPGQGIQISKSTSSVVELSEDSMVSSQSDNQLYVNNDEVEGVSAEEIATDTACVDFINRLTRVINKFPGKRPHCVVFCSYSFSSAAPDVSIDVLHGVISNAYKSHIIATVQRVFPPKILHGKKVKIII